MGTKARTATADRFAYGGAEALVELHEAHMRRFLDVWREANERGTRLPETDDPNYASRDALLAHVLGASARYLVWICEHIGAPAPPVERRPATDGIADRAEAYLDQVLAAWSVSLRDLTEERAYAPAHASNWGPPYCVDAMMEHAVMHPIRHVRQLERLSATDSADAPERTSAESVPDAAPAPDAGGAP